MYRSPHMCCIAVPTCGFFFIMADSCFPTFTGLQLVSSKESASDQEVKMVKISLLLFILILAKCLLSDGVEKDSETMDVESITCDKQGNPQECAAAVDSERFRYVRSSEQEDFEAKKTDPYSSYLDYPRLTFSGEFRADVPTLNNLVKNYDVDDLMWGTVDRHDNWNPAGSGAWEIDANVTSLCYKNGSCVSHKDNIDYEPALGIRVKDGGIGSPGKMSALDVQVETFTCEIWGWRVQVGDLFSGAFNTTGAQYLWRKVPNGTNDDPYRGAVYQSVLTDITWMDSTNASESRFTKQLRHFTKKGSGALSIRFNLYGIDEEHPARLGVGKITGSIGVSGVQAPPFVTKGRLLKAEVDYVQDAPFKVDDVSKRLMIDFGNSLPITVNGSVRKDLLGTLRVALLFEGATAKDACSKNTLHYIGGLDYTDTSWYETTAGIQVYDLLPQCEAPEIESSPVVVVKVKEASERCEQVLLAEEESGAIVLPWTTWIQRVESSHHVIFEFLVTEFGKPMPHKTVVLQPCDCAYVFVQGLKVGVPKLKVPKKIKTDEYGKAKVQIRTVEPVDRDDYIDGQLYGYQYCVQGTCLNQKALCNEKDRFKLMKNLIVFRVFSTCTTTGDVTWMKDVYPIFNQYDTLFPVMRNFMDLGNYYKVLENKEDILFTLRLPREDPNHMPVTRDLSESRREMIVNWLSQHDPPKENPNYADYTLKNLRRDLQTAIQLEHATIPTYLTAMASIRPSYNQDVYDILKTIVVQEMLHLALAANLLNAVGGMPRLHYKEFTPRYPTFLPGGVIPDLVVPIQKCSISVIRNVFLAIEEPVITKNIRAAEYAAANENDTCTELYKACKAKPVGYYASRSNEGETCVVTPIIPALETHHSTIGAFYHHILCSFHKLVCQDQEPIFTGKVSKQVHVDDFFGRGKYGHGKLFRVTGLKSAVKAINEIVHQGEGSSPCNPIAWMKGKAADVSHYFLFESIVHGAEIVVCNTTAADIGTGDEEKCASIKYNYTGPMIPFDPDGVWPMIPNPSMDLYAPGSNAQSQAIMFNRIYTRLLLSLEEVFNGKPEKLGEAIAVMHHMVIHMNNLMRTPIDDNGHPDVGPNAGPTFDFMP